MKKSELILNDVGSFGAYKQSNTIPIQIPCAVIEKLKIKVYWVLDVTFKEDDNRIHTGDGAKNVNIIQSFVTLYQKKESMRGKLKQASWSGLFRQEIIFGKGLKVCYCSER